MKRERVKGGKMKEKKFKNRKLLFFYFLITLCYYLFSLICNIFSEIWEKI